MADCLFCRMARGDIPARKVYEDEFVLAFHDIKPAAPVHILLIPKQHIASMAALESGHEALMGHLMVTAPRVAREQGCTDGFRTIVNTGRVGLQEVYHLHVHIVGGPQLLPPMLKH
ncbi:histidine triad nucleotide-binding protein [Azoarcus sp. L1K30]|uniref:histidine triad nucleotide-binding protein n=1 Tax=Azoarcus sp. L1K30 TaxID=2820277 RepID=UPI001B83B8CE|nr:histidine triad nucleotide-binding protein [Azoarcus sp. L1K30]MBR0568331.1 histidine triad nucleotide-binding protein [Azoarcus sp. L1K30]